MTYPGWGPDKARLFTGTMDRQTSVDTRSTSKQTCLVRFAFARCWVCARFCRCWQNLSKRSRPRPPCPKHCMFSGEAVEALISWKDSANIGKILHKRALSIWGGERAVEFSRVFSRLPTSLGMWGFLWCGGNGRGQRGYICQSLHLWCVHQLLSACCTCPLWSLYWLGVIS